MTELWWTAAMFAAGGVLAAAWLAGLWINVRGLAREARPRARLAVGALMRLSMVAAGFYLVTSSHAHWAQILAALAGFAVVRSLVLWRVRSRVAMNAPAARDAP